MNFATAETVLNWVDRALTSADPVAFDTAESPAERTAAIEDALLAAGARDVHVSGSAGLDGYLCAITGRFAVAIVHIDVFSGEFHTSASDAPLRSRPAIPVFDRSFPGTALN